MPLLPSDLQGQRRPTAAPRSTEHIFAIHAVVLLLLPCSTEREEALTLEEVSKHNTKDDCWLIIVGKLNLEITWTPERVVPQEAELAVLLRVNANKETGAAAVPEMLLYLEMLDWRKYPEDSNYDQMWKSLFMTLG